MTYRPANTLPFTLFAAALMVLPGYGQSGPQRLTTPPFIANEASVTWLRATEPMTGHPSPRTCRIDACEAPAGWDDAINATVRISNGCTGVLVNNTDADRTPYILTAHHCGRPSIGQMVDWTFYFNDQATDCANPQPPASADTLQGAIVRAAMGGYHDYVLLELLEPVPAAYNVSFAGWSIADAGSTARSTRPASGIVIGHPQQDRKKVTRDDHPIEHYGLTHWVGQFDQGTIEVGSSGSPLFNEHGDMIGLVRAALQIKTTCSGPGGDDNEAVVLFPKLSYNWDAGAKGERLSEYLDPAGTGAVRLGALGPPPVKPPPASVWINEVNAFSGEGHHDEFIEIAGDVGTDLSGYQIDIYTCKKGETRFQSTQTVDRHVLQVYDPTGAAGDGDVHHGYYVIDWASRTAAPVAKPLDRPSNHLPDGAGRLVLKDRSGAEVFNYQYDHIGVAGGSGETRACPADRTTRSAGDAAGAGAGSMGFPFPTVPSAQTPGAALAVSTPGAPNLAKEASAFSAARMAEPVLAAERLDTDRPKTFVLSPPYPNPFNPQTTIRFALPEAAAVTLVVYDMQGREVQRLVEGVLSAGHHEVSFEAGRLASGTYLYRMQAGAFTQVRRMVLVK